ncbi:MAG: DUF3987 domain-containing protein [Clostridium lundense]|nr:DUF3987 domain-containing protein [Clostridium lundense]
MSEYIKNPPGGDAPERAKRKAGGNSPLSKIISRIGQFFKGKEDLSLQEVEIEEMLEKRKDQPAEDWPEVIPFDEPLIPPRFPVEALPKHISPFVRSVAESTQTPVEMAGILSLSTLSTVFQSRFEVQINTDWKEPLCLYTVAVALPGERKSAVIKALESPILEYERRRQEIEAPEIAKNASDRKMLEERREAAEEAALYCNEDERDQKEQEAFRLAEQLAEFKEMHETRLLVDDTTPEKLIELMAEQGGCMTVCSAEGGIFDTIRGRYNKSSNLDIYLKAHSGDPIMVDRIGRKNNRIEAPRLSMILTIQPEVLDGLMNDNTLRGRGLCGRFLYAICSFNSKVGMRNSTPEPVPEDIRRNFHDFIIEGLSGEEKGILYLDESADALRVEFQDLVERRLGGEWKDIRDWGGKYVGTMVRIAALIHCAQAEESPLKNPISAESVSSAIRIAECLGAHAAATYQIMGVEAKTTDAKYLLSRILSRGTSSINRSDLTRYCKGNLSIAAMDEALEALIAHGYLVCDSAEVGYKNRTSRIYKINPKCSTKNFDAQFS